MRKLRVLVACEMSGVVRDAFSARGHEAWSCDFLPTERPGRHHQGNILDTQLLKKGFDLMIAHPDCTFLTVSGARWFSIPWRGEAQLSALHFVKALMAFPIERICIENPIGVLSKQWRKPDQIIQPWQFWAGEPGAGEVKATCLWLKNLPPLVPTTPNETGRHPACWLESPGPMRKINRSRTYAGIAAQMAAQWG